MNNPPIHKTPLVVIGGGAAGLMGACRAAELGVPTLILERKHRLGSKLLMCGNGRCNLSSSMTADRMRKDFGAPLDAFLKPALDAFGPDRLVQWFETRGLPLMKTSDGKLFPRSERAPDVVHCFQDELRQLESAICLQSPVEAITPLEDGFRIETTLFHITARQVLVTTGGVSYPKTGSVGDGQRFANSLGIRVQPFRPGLVGIQLDHDWIRRYQGKPFKQARVQIYDGSVLLGEERGLLECERWGLGGGCISNATRILSRTRAIHPCLHIHPGEGQPSLRVEPLIMRPLKEAMVTVGGVDLAEVNPATMECIRYPGLFFAGEVLDIDGPTGGYNLTAAFATARLAAEEIARRTGATRQPVNIKPTHPPRRRHDNPHTKQSRGPQNRQQKNRRGTSS